MSKIPAGLATIFGLVLAAAQAAAALICYLSGDHETARELIGGTVVTGGITKAGRFLEAHAAIVNAAREASPVIDDLSHLVLPTASDAELGANAQAVAASPDGVDGENVDFAHDVG